MVVIEQKVERGSCSAPVDCRARSADQIAGGAAGRESVGRSGAGIPRRWDDRRADRGPGEDRSAASHLANFGHALQGREETAAGDRQRAECGRGGGRRNAAFRRPCEHPRAIDPRLSSRAPGALGVLGMCYGLAGRKVEANKTLDELLELNRRRYVTPVAVVHVYTVLGDKDRAFACSNSRSTRKGLKMVDLTERVSALEPSTSRIVKSA